METTPFFRPGQKAANGFEALKELDSNKDGIVDEGELLTIEQAA